MPNWCECELTLEGPEEMRNDFIEKVKLEGQEAAETTHSILQKLLPIPEEIAKTISPMQVVETEQEARVENIKSRKYQSDNEKDYIRAITKEEAERRKQKYGAIDWYDWCSLHWGTKWGDCRTYLGYSNEKKTFFEFESAWGPPTEGITEISKQFPKLKFTMRYWECGMGFKGKVVIKNGEIIDEMSGSYRGNRGG